MADKHTIKPTPEPTTEHAGPNGVEGHFIGQTLEIRELMKPNAPRAHAKVDADLQPPTKRSPSTRSERVRK